MLWGEQWIKYQASYGDLSCLAFSTCNTLYGHMGELNPFRVNLHESQLYMDRLGKTHRFV